jgi:hypothetical protein
MRSGWLLFAIILVGLYVIIRIDFLPDVIPVLGWLDDTFLVGLLLYYFRYRRLPGFIMKLVRLLFPPKGGADGSAAGKGGQKEKTGGQNGERHRSTRPKEPHAVLGISPGASRREIQVAYREAVQKYHPDKVSHLGTEFQELAERKFVEIQQAYDELMKR